MIGSIIFEIRGLIIQHRGTHVKKMGRANVDPLYLCQYILVCKNIAFITYYNEKDVCKCDNERTPINL